MVAYPKYGGMFDWALAVPAAGLASCVLRSRANRSRLGGVVVLAQAVGALLAIFGEDRTGRFMGGGVTVAAWVWTLVHVNGGSAADPPLLKLVEAFSPTSYVLAYPLFFTGQTTLERAVGAAILVIHAVTIPSIVILMWAEELHERWGCYGSQASIYDYDKGMCGMWNIDQVQVCRDLQSQRGEINFDCTSDTVPWEFFGRMIHRIVGYEMVAVNFWVVLMIEQFATMPSP